MFKRIVKNNSLVYLAGEILSKLSPFIALPLLTRVLTVDQFALYSLFLITVFFAYILSSLATVSFIPIVFFKNKDDLLNTIRTVLTVSHLVGCFFTVLLIVFFAIFKDLKSYSFSILMAALVGYISVYIQVKLSIYQCKKQAVRYVSLTVTRSFIFLIFVFIGFHLNIAREKYFIISYAVSYIVVLPLVLVSFSREFGTEVFRFKIDRNVVEFGLPSIPNAVSNWAKTSIDRYFIVFSLGTIQLGLYSAAYQLAFGVIVISGALVKAMSPSLFSELKNRGYDSYVKSYCIKYFLLYVAISLVYCVFLFYCSEMILGGSYSNVNIYSSLLVISAIFQGSASFFVGVLFYNEKVSKALTFNLVSLSVHSALLFVLTAFSASIEYYIYASIFSSFLYFILIFRSANAHYNKST